MSTTDAWPTISEFVRNALVAEDDELAWRDFYQRLERAREVDPEEAPRFFLALLRNPLRQVRELATTVGAKLVVPEVVRALPGLLDDPAWEVQELAMQVLAQVSPDTLRNLPNVLRRKFSEWRRVDDNAPLVHLAWTAVKLNIAELAPEIRRMAEDEALHPSRRRQAFVYAVYLEKGPAEVIRRIQEHDHEHMLDLCMLAWMTDIDGARAAYERCAAGAPDEICRGRCQRFAAKAAEAEAAGTALSSRPSPR